MIQPTLGRIVWFTPAQTDNALQPSDTGKCAGIVTHVWNERLVNLAVFDMHGVLFPKPSVPLLQDDDVPVTGSQHCEWMPYQKNKDENSKLLSDIAADVAKDTAPETVAPQAAPGAPAA